VSTPSVHPNPHVKFTTLHCDGDLTVVVKPPGMVTQPGVGHEHDSLLNGLYARHGAALQRLGSARDFGLLHRLDRETSGLLVVALRAGAYDHLRRAFEARRIGKYYWAVVQGVPRAVSGVVRRPIAEVQSRPESRSSARAPTMKLAKVSRSGKPAVTAYRVLSSGRGASLVECRTLTGRLHQIRVHMESIGCPVLGDGLYAPASARALSRRLALHAHRLVLPHPSGRALDCRSAWPADLRGLLTRFLIERPTGSGSAAFADTPGVKGDEELNNDGVGDHESAIGE